MLLWLGRLDVQIGEETWEIAGLILVIVTVGREIAITGLRAIASTVGISMPADRWGKLKTWIQFWAIIFLLIGKSFWLPIGQVLLLVSVIAALISAVQYTIQFVKQLPS